MRYVSINIREAMTCLVKQNRLSIPVGWIRNINREEHLAKCYPRIQHSPEDNDSGAIQGLCGLYSLT